MNDSNKNDSMLTVRLGSISLIQLNYEPLCSKQSNQTNIARSNSTSIVYFYRTQRKRSKDGR